MLDSVLACASLLFGSVFYMVFLLQRRAYRRRRRKRQEPGFYPSTRDLGNALHSLQMFARPEIAHVTQVKQAEPKEEEANGDD